MAAEVAIEKATTVKSIPFSFYEVVATIFNRYPNPCSSHVQCTDYIQPLTVGPDGAVTCKILNQKTNNIPGFVQRYQDDIGAPRFDVKSQKFIKVIKIVEEYKIDLAGKVMTQLSWNLDSRNLLRTHEFVKYTSKACASTSAAGLNELGKASIQRLSPAHSDILIGQTSAVQQDHSGYNGSTGVASSTDSTTCLRNQTYLEKTMYFGSPLHWSLARPLRAYTSRKWLKQESRATHGLCYCIANNLYNKNLANEFIQAGLNDTALNKMKSKLTLYRLMLYENRHLFTYQEFTSKTRKTTYEKIHNIIKKEQEMKQKIRNDIMGYIKNPKFQLMMIEKLKKMPR